MTVFDWDEKTLVSSGEFQPNDQGLDDFEYLLKNSLKMPGRLLVDMIEEDFRRETIPHVNFMDRRGLISRLVDKHYRDTTDVHAHVMGRSKIGRKDDRVLLSALTNTSLLAPWLDRLQSSNTRLAGIWSIPLLTDKLLKTIVEDDEHALIVSARFVALCATATSRRKLLLSRQAKFDKDMWDRKTSKASSLISSAVLSVITSCKIKESWKAMITSTSIASCNRTNSPRPNPCSQYRTSSLRVPELRKLFNNFGVQGCEGAVPTHCLHFCVLEPSLNDHYAQRRNRPTGIGG